LAVSPESLARRHTDWVRLISVWDRIVRYLRDPATQGSAIEIMSIRSGVEPSRYARMISGTRFLTLKEGLQVMTANATAGLGSLKVSNLISNDFNLKNNVYQASQEADVYFDARPKAEALAAAERRE
jgi:NitT/TauT family transport system substrate-binding protein